MNAYDNDGKLVGGKSASESNVFEFDIDDVDLHAEEGSAFSNLFGASFFAEGERKGVFEYDFALSDYKDMLSTDGKAASLERALTAPVMSAEWKLNAPDDDKGQTAFLEQFLKAPRSGGGMRSNFRNVIGQATTARTYRKAFFEKTYKAGTGVFEGQVVYDDIAFRPVDTCKLWVDEETGRFKGFRQRAVRKISGGAYRLDDNELLDFPPPYCWVHVNGQHRDPIGGSSDMEVALWSWKTKKRVLWMWAVFLMTQGNPRTIVSGTNGDKAAKELRKLKSGGVAFVGDATVEVLEPSGTGAQAFKDFMAYLDSQMLASCLAGFLDLTSPSQATGSYALSADQSSFFKRSEERFRLELEQSITDNVLADLVALNFGSEASVPEFKFAPFESSGVEEMISLITPRISELPFEFIAMLTEKLGSVFGLPEEELRAMLDEAAEVAEEKKQMGLEQEKAMAAQGMNPMMQANAAVDMVAKKTGMKPPVGNPFKK